MKILFTAAQRGPAQALIGPAAELKRRSHTVVAYATGSANEATGFNDFKHRHITPKDDEIADLVSGFDAVVTGFSDSGSPDARFTYEANQRGIPTIAVLDQNGFYEARVHPEIEFLPQVIASMTDACSAMVQEELANELGREVAKRMHVVGWTGLDHVAEKREAWTEADRISLLTRIGIDPGNPVYLHLTQTVHPDSAYQERSPEPREWKQAWFDYERRVTEAVFSAAADLGIVLVVKPHPGEAYKVNTTKDQADRFGFVYLGAKACQTSDLMLASQSISAGRSSALQEATLFDRNTGAFLPDEAGSIPTFPSVALDAIPYATRWEEIPSVLKYITTKNAEQLAALAEQRKKFAVDGYASQRCADLIERVAA